MYDEKRAYRRISGVDWQYRDEYWAKVDPEKTPGRISEWFEGISEETGTMNGRVESLGEYAQIPCGRAEKFMLPQAHGDNYYHITDDR